MIGEKNYLFNIIVLTQIRCDRIIWYGEGLKQHFYTRGESKLSDHRPVKAILSADVRVLRRARAFRGFFLSERFDQNSINN